MEGSLRSSTGGLLLPRPGKRPKRELSLAVTAGQAAEDGDYVALRRIREARRKSITPRKVEDITEDSDKGTDNERRDEVSEAIKSNSVDTFKDVIRNADLLDPDLCETETNKNILHYALENECLEIAEYLIETGPEGLLSADMWITHHGVSSRRNALQQIMLLKNVKLASSLLRRLTDSKRRNDLIVQETPVEIKGQRPRTLSALHLAAFHGCSDIIQLFLSYNVNVNLLNAKRDTPLLWASRWGHEKTVRLLLENRADPNQENDKGSTALHWAIRYGHYSCAKLLISGGADVNKTRKIGLVAPIVLASALGDNDMVILLLESGADPNHVIRAKERPLHHAAREGHLEVVETLLNRKASVDVQNERGETPLLEAATNDEESVVDLLLKSGADLTQKNHEGVDAWTAAIESPGNNVLKVLSRYMKSHDLAGKVNPPFCIAANAGSIDKIEALLALGTDPKDTDLEGNTFLHYAATNNYSEIIKKYHKEVDINSQNKSGDTALHLACFYGHHEAIQSLSHAKARADLQNVKGETALHVSAKSKDIAPQSIELLIKHVIKTHAWMSLHVQDFDGHNALHLAGQHASPAVMWEFRFVRLKDYDKHGETPLHDAVRPGEPEALNTMLDIYDTMKRDADINTQNAPKHTVLHLAALQGFDSAIRRLILYGADLSLQDENGDTVLHLLTKASATDTQHNERHLNTVIVILNEAVRWYCIKNELAYPEVNGDLYYKYKKEAVLYLIHDITNKQQLSVVSSAFQNAAHAIVEKLLTIDRVTKFTDTDGTVLFDVSRLTPKTSRSNGGCCCRGQNTPILSSLECMVQTDAPHRASNVLDIPPIKEIEDMYESMCRRTYALLMIMHIIYMSIFTFVGITLQDKLRIGKTYSIDTPTVIMYIVLPIEPFILTVYLIYGLVSNLVNHGCSMKNLISLSSSTNIILATFETVAIVIYNVLIITWIILYSTSTNYQDNVLSVSILMGWIASIFLTRGFKGINYFWKMLQNIIVRDMYRFLFVYVFVVVAFSFAFHVLFQISDTIVDKYSTPGDTFFMVFNLMVGMGELFDDTIDNGLSAVGRSPTFMKLVYLLYIILSTVILLNLLIAMMNDSYSSILASHRVTWRLESVRLGMTIDKLFPFMTNLMVSSKFIQKREKDFEDFEQLHYYISIKQQRLAKLESHSGEDEGDVLAVLKPQMDAIEERILKTDKRVTDEVSDLRSQLNEMSQILQDIKSELKK